VRRRAFLHEAGLGILALGLSAFRSGPLAAAEPLPRRPIPGTADSLPIVGMGNSNAFRQGDLAASADLLRLFREHGGGYVDCSGDSRFTVAEAARTLNGGGNLFLGSYFADADEALNRRDLQRLLDLTGGTQLDLAHSYPEFAIPNWRRFEAWKDEGLTRYIGIARHQSSYYDGMIELMDTGTVDFLQVNYSPLETEADQRVLPTALDRGVAVTINRPFLNGEYFARVRGHELPEWAAEFDCRSWAQFSLKFILAHPAVTCVLTETANPDHLRDNLGAGYGRLPDAATRQRMVEHLRRL
jgi:hypothetical protein